MSIDAGERLQRLLRLMPVIVDRGDVPISEVQSLAGVDALTLLDDLRALTERDDDPASGHVEAVTILFEPESVCVHSPHFARPVRITMPELCALELGLAILGASAAAGERTVIERARSRVRSAIAAMPEAEVRNDLWYATGPRVSNERILETLRAGVDSKTKVRIVYRRGDSQESTDRVVHPYAVVPVRGAWFLVAHCERTNEMRFFRVDRVISVIPSEAPVIPSEALRPRAVQAARGRDLLFDHTRMMSPTTERLVVRYSPRIARWIAEREEGEQEPDGSFIVSHPLGDDAWAVRHVLQYGPEATVLDPPRIRERVRTTLRAMAAAIR